MVLGVDNGIKLLAVAACHHYHDHDHNQWSIFYVPAHDVCRKNEKTMTYILANLICAEQNKKMCEQGKYLREKLEKPKKMCEICFLCAVLRALGTRNASKLTLSLRILRFQSFALGYLRVHIKEKNPLTPSSPLEVPVLERMCGSECNATLALALVLVQLFSCQN